MHMRQPSTAAGLGPLSSPVQLCPHTEATGGRIWPGRSTGFFNNPGRASLCVTPPAERFSTGPRFLLHFPRVPSGTKEPDPFGQKHVPGSQRAKSKAAAAPVYNTTRAKSQTPGPASAVGCAIKTPGRATIWRAFQGMVSSTWP